MKKRLRKKIHLAEFTEFGFQVRFKIHAEEEGADADKLRLKTWLSGDPSIVEPHIGPLVDAWNSR